MKLRTNRGGPEAVAKRRAARALNAAFRKEGGMSIDGRTLKRKRRLVKELRDGRDGRPLKALDVLQHSHELLQLGETLTSIRKLKPRAPTTPAITDEFTAVVCETQASYGFDPRAWMVLGVDIDQLGAASSRKPEKAPASRRKKRR